MTIGSKISLVYSALTILLVVAIGAACWLAVGNYCERLYFRHLEEKARFVAMERFEKDELDSLHYRLLVEQRANAISTDRCVMVNMADSDAHAQLVECLSEQEVERLVVDGVLHTQRDMGTSQVDDDETCAGIIYEDNEGTFAVLLFSHNPYLRELSRHIGVGLLIAVLLTSLLLYLLSRLYAVRTVNNIDRAYQTERLFVSNASHEINNPLSAIKGECELALMRERSGEEYRTALEKIGEETDRIITVMHGLMQLSHAERECSQQLAIFSMRKLLLPFASEGVRIVVKEDFTVEANETLLQIAFRNIISNAVKYGKGELVTVVVEKPCVCVTDNGIGIPSQDLPHIFDPFFRSSNAAAHRGHGIGLALAHKILQATGFEVAVSSDVGGGTRFSMTYRNRHSLKKHLMLI